MGPLRDTIASDSPLAGRYVLQRLLGSGGQAVVYAAHDRVLDRPVALKVLQARFSHDARLKARFRWEANAAASICHPNVVRVYDAGTDGEVHFIAMELVDGRPLSELIAAEGPLRVETAVAIAADVAAALQAAHDGGLAHRDVKPGNVIVTPEGSAKVVDFGIMRSIEGGATETMGLFGTAAYLSPEQALGRPVDGRTDLYSLGCVLYEMLTGRPPYEDESAMAVCAQHVHGKPAPPSALRPDLPPALEGVVLRALAKDPDDRYPTAAAMGRALLAASGTSARPAYTVFRGRPTGGRRLTKALALVVGAGAALALLGATALAPDDAVRQAQGVVQGQTRDVAPASPAASADAPSGSEAHGDAGTAGKTVRDTGAAGSPAAASKGDGAGKDGGDKDKNGAGRAKGDDKGKGGGKGNGGR